MFEVTQEDIEALDDKQLRELVARAAQAEAQRHGHSPLHVTWGGNQTAPDGGLDVKADIPFDVPCPALPRGLTGYQVKKPDMSAGDIREEMRPNGVLRDIFPRLAAAGGAYLIVSSTGTLSETFLVKRRAAIRQALHDCPDQENLFTDFLDRRRLADWVNQHAGVVAWVREQAGRSLQGWQAYSAWSNVEQGMAEAYLCDARLRIRMDGPNDPHLPVNVAIERLRLRLAQPREILRLVGLSGVGKTRLLQALFDERVGQGALAKSLAVYTDLNNDPAPTPFALASNLVAQGLRAVLIVDNCSASLHQELVKICRDQAQSQLSLVTVEYDVREGVMERGQLVIMDTASTSLIEQLLLNRFRKLSTVNAKTIAAASGGNARIAMAIAATVDATESLAGLTNELLFDRLFHQRHDPDGALIKIAQACSMVYSFDGIKEEGGDAELTRLAILAGQTFDDAYGHLSTLQQRDLVQSRGDWRAMLPHALANYLAGRGLNAIVPARVQQQITDSGNQRLVLSFARRLAFLHTHPRAIALCQEWLRPTGLLGNPSDLKPHEVEMFTLIAAVAPADALAALERNLKGDREKVRAGLEPQLHTIRKIAYDAALFDRCVQLLEHLVLTANHRVDAEVAEKATTSFFQLRRSYTLAQPPQRFSHIARWLVDGEPKRQLLGRLALGRALSLEASADYSGPFGARVRDEGYEPTTDEEFLAWFNQALHILEAELAPGGAHVDFCRTLLAKTTRELWCLPGLRGRLEVLMIQCAAGKFWRDGWIASMDTLHANRFDSEAKGAADVLVKQLAPQDLASRILSVALPGSPTPLVRGEKEEHVAFAKRVNSEAEILGELAAGDAASLSTVLPRLLQTNGRGESFGCGLAHDPTTTAAVWDAIKTEWGGLPADKRNPSVLRGFMNGLAKHDRPGADTLLDYCIGDAALAPAVPAMQAALGFDPRGMLRLQQGFDMGVIPLTEFHFLTGAVWASETVQVHALALVGQIAAVGKPEAFDIALHIVSQWWTTLEVNGGTVTPSVLHLCAQVMRHAQFAGGARHGSDVVARIANQVLGTADGAEIATLLAQRLRAAVPTSVQVAFDNQELLAVLFKRQPDSTMTALCDGDDEDRRHAIELLNAPDRPHAQPGRAMDPDALVAWCAGCPAIRFAFAIEAIPVLMDDSNGAAARFTPQAMAVLHNAPDPNDVVVRLIGRLEPSSWSGSRASILEHNLAALDGITDLFDEAFQSFVRIERARVLEYVGQERAHESKSMRMRDERFE